MQKTVFIALLLVLSISCFAQKKPGYSPAYHFLTSGSIVADKNFYLLTCIGHSQQLVQTFATDESLAGLLRTRCALIRAHATDTCRSPESLLEGFKWTKEDSVTTDSALRGLYARNSGIFNRLIDSQLRPSGSYQRFDSLGDLDLLLYAWGQVIVGCNYIIDQYGLGRKMRYPAIDSASYDVHGDFYRHLLKILFPYLQEKTAAMQLFYQPSLTIALELMKANDRDEPARFEPLEKGENQMAVAQVKKIVWSQYKYAAIMVPGEGPELTTVPFDPIGRMRCELAADRYRKGLAPFIIVSGGYCHPFHTPYCEALEMKRYLVRDCGIPGGAVIMEPQARHTTTNFRNADRLAIRYGMPLNKTYLCVTTKDQADYIDNPSFDRRNFRELGYLPYRDKQRVGDHEISYSTVLESLQRDPTDPLDP